MNRLDAWSAIAPPAPPPAPTGARTADDARRVALEFESFFVAQVLDSMFAGLATDGPFGGGQAEQVYRSLLNQEFGRVLSRAGGIGLADDIRREILRLQEVS
jgi:flagellar protein FlgJ